MTDLIDRDVLREQYLRAAWTTSVLQLIDAAPTVEPGQCGECAHLERRTLSGYIACAKMVLTDKRDFGCTLFTARDREESDA